MIVVGVTISVRWISGCVPQVVVAMVLRKVVVPRSPIKLEPKKKAIWKRL
jgi:hypothetical protein